MTRIGLKLLAVMAAAASLAACASGPTGIPAPAPRAPPPAPSRPAPPPAPQAVPAIERIHRAVDFLNHGQPDLARPELAAVLAEIPGDHTAVSLLEQIERDPRSLLGERNFPYRLRPGETLTALAERFLGDPMLFYALARYNGIDAPLSVEPGRALLIPGVPKRIGPAPAQTTAPPSPTPIAKPPAAAAGANPARASQLRRLALENLNKGAIDRAVALLQQAMPLDPANPLIKGDLDRALRIQASLKKK